MLRTVPIVLSLLLTTPAWGGATVTGTVTAPALSPPKPIRVTVDAHACGVEQPVYGDRPLVDAAGRLDGAAVVLEAVGKRRLPKHRGPRMVTIVQRNCSIEPRLSVVEVGTKVRLKNADPLLHALRATGDDGRLIASVVLPMRDQEADAFIARRPGPIWLRGDTGHSWMNGAVLVVEHGLFDRTDARGQFQIDDVPTGEYRLIVWHPKLGRTVRTIHVGKDGVRVLIRVEGQGL